MKINVKKETLFKALQKISNIVGSRTTLPVLANVLVEAEEGMVTLSTTDLEIRLSTKIEAEVESSGRTTIPVKRLLGLVSKLRGETVTLHTNENHHTQITCGTAAFTLLGLNPDDFPISVEFHPQRVVKIKESDISSIIDRISYAASLDDSRKVLQGILFSIRESKLTAVATDGKRLALVEKLLDEAPSGVDGDIIITLKSAQELKRIIERDGELSMEIGESQIVFRMENTVMTSKLIDGSYPNYQQVIPATFAKKIQIPCEPFIYALDIVNVTLADAEAPYVKLTFRDGKLIFEANSNYGEGRESIDIEYDGEEMIASFNPHFLLDPFKHIGVDNITLKINDVFSPIALESGDGFLYVIMPMRNK